MAFRIKSAILLALSLTAVTACATDSRMPGTVVVTADDGLRVHAYFEPSPDKAASAPLLIMLPMRGQTHTSYDSLKSAIKQWFDTAAVVSGPRPHQLTLDLRGHGASTLRGNDTVDFQTMADSEYAKIPRDVALVIDSVVAALGSRADTGRIYVTGASIGANAAIMTTALRPGIAKVVMLSPGTDYRGMKPAEAFANFPGQTLIVTGRGDGYSYNSAQQLMKLKMKDWLLKAYPSDLHGTTLIDKDDRARQDVVAWLFQ